MKNSLTLLIAVVIVLVLLVYMFLFQVRYDQVAVVTTFGKAGDNSIKRPRKWPYLRWPWPIQKVTRYPTRLQILEDQLEQQQTADKYAVIVQTYVAWRVDIDNPLDFYSGPRSVDQAAEHLTGHVRDSRAIISRYQFNELVNADSAKVKLGIIEKKIQDQLQDRVRRYRYGIEIEQFGIRRILLPEEVTENVFESMRARRLSLAADTLESGKAEAKRIESQANSMKERILAFSNVFAEQIKSMGDREAAAQFDVFAKDPQFALFLRKLETLETMFTGATLLLPAEQLMSPDAVFKMPSIESPVMSHSDR